MLFKGQFTYKGCVSASKSSCQLFFSTRNGLSAELGGFGGLLERTTSGVWHHEDRDTPLWLLLPTHTTNNTSPPNNHADLSPSTHRSHRRVHVGRRALRAAVCGVWRSSAHTNTQLAPPRWLCGQCPSSARRWGCMPVDVAVWAMAPLRGGTAPTRRGRATGKKVQPNDKKQ